MAAEGTKAFKVDRTLDVKGLLCPVPVQKTKAAMGEMKPGEVLEVISTDPEAKTDIPQWVTREGHQLLAVSDEWLVLRFYIKKREAR